MAHSTQDIVVLDTYERQDIVVSDTYERRQAILDDACFKYIEIGFPSDMFTTRKIHENGYNYKEFLELIKPLHMMEDREELTCLTASVPKDDLGKFIEFMEGLKTEEGIQSISDAFARISKKNVVITEEGVALAHKLVGYAAAQRLNHKKIIDNINELMRCQRDLEKKSSDIIEDLKMKLGPLYGYKEPSLRELRIEAYKLYENDCKAKSIPAVPIDHEMGFEIAIQEFGAAVKNRHLINYLSDPIRKEKIEKHFKENSFRFDYVADDDEEGGGGRYETFELAADSGEAKVTLATKVVCKFTSKVFSDKASPSSGETDGTLVSNSAESVKAASDERAQTDASNKSQSKRKRDVSEGVSVEPQDSEKPATKDSERPTTKNKKNQEKVHGGAGL